MAEIKEVIEDAKDFLGDKGFIILIGGFAFLFIVNLLKQSNDSSETLVPATGYVAYPDASANANVIIDSLQNSIDYSQGEILSNMYDSTSNISSKLDDMTSNITDEFGALGDHIESNHNDMKDYLDINFSATNDYINSGLEAQKKLINQNTQDILGDINDARNSMMNSIASNSEMIKQQNARLQNELANQKKAQQKTTTKKKNSSGSSKGATVTYYAKTPYTGVSIVDGLKAIGVDSSYQHREQIAKANGITNYSGTAKQNTQLLNMLKSGTLRR